MFYKILRESNREGVEDLIKYLKESEFDKTPASTRYHLAEEGGLIEHSLNVYFTASEINKTLGSPVNDNSIKIISLLHDIGKHEYYNKKYYIPKLLKNGKPAAQPYQRNKEVVPLPHEVSAIHIISKYIDLTEEETWAIVHHNGLYSDLKYNLMGNETPAQMILHFADMWASRVIE